jgi:hypothetical protein
MAEDRVCANVANRRKSLVFNIPTTRYTPVNPYALGFTQAQLDMRRKAEVLQYNKTSNGRTTNSKKWVNVVNGKEQRRKYSSYVLKQIADGNGDPCPNDLYLPTLTTGCDVPGPPMYLYYDPTVPLYNYNSQQIAYGTQNVSNLTNWIIANDTDIASNNAKLLTMNIQPGISQSSYTYSVTTSVVLQINGTVQQSEGPLPTGKFNIGIPAQNIGLQILYGNQPVINVSSNVAFEPGFLTDVSGETVSSSFTGSIYMGNITFSGILLNTVPGYTYDFYISYIPSFTNEYINAFNVQLVSNVKDTVPIQELGFHFMTPVSTSPMNTLTVVGV